MKRDFIYVMFLLRLKYGQDINVIVGENGIRVIRLNSEMAVSLTNKEFEAVLDDMHNKASEQFYNLDNSR